MSWLRELMAESPTAVRSLGGLARRALAHPAWPKESRPQERSLAALLSKVDRGLELDWLGDRPEVQRVLADVLGTAPGRIAEAVGRGVEKTDSQRRRVRLVDLPLSSPLDLASERLPPGIPPRMLRPVEWNRTFWVAPRGSGRSLTGAWLAARSLAVHVRRSTWAEALAVLPESGPVFVEVLDEASLDDVVLPRSDVCVAAGRLPRSGAEALDVVRSEAPEAWLEELVTWIALRLPRDGHFEPASALSFLRDAARDGIVTRLGDALGLAGLLDARGAKELARIGMARAADAFVSERLAKSGSVDEGDRSWLERNGARIVVALAKSLLASAGSVEVPRSEATFIELVPAEYRGGVDAEWVRLSLARASGPATVKELERALAELPPGAFRVVRALTRAGILESEGGADALVFGPAWLATWTFRRARESLLHGSLVEYGEALLSAEPAWAARGVIRRVRDGDVTVLEDVLDAEELRDAPSVAALELSVRAAGLATLQGAELPEDLRAPLFDLALGLVVEREDGPHPRIGYPAAVVEREPLLDVGVYRLALLALGESLPDSRGASHPVLRAVGAAPEPAALGSVYESIWRAAVRAGWSEPWALAALELAARSDFHARTRLEVPAALLDAVRQEAPELAVAHDVEREVLRATLALGALRGVTEESILRLLWRAWETAPDDLRGTSLAPDWELGRAVYAAAPPGALARILDAELVDVSALPYDVFDRAQWEALLARELGRPSFDATRLGVVFAREPELLLDVIADAVVANDARAGELLRAAPPGATRRIVEKLKELRALVPEALTSPALRAWLHDRIAERADGFRDALELLG